MTQPPLKPLHDQSTLSTSKLAIFDKQSTESLRASLAPGHQHCLKTRPDGTMLDGHHRVQILRLRNEDVNTLPREIISPG